jgi:hypothetical protein
LEPPTIDVIDRNHIAGTFRSLGVFIWRYETTPAAVRLGAAMMSDLYERFPGEPFGLLQVVETSASMPDADARAALTDLLKAGSKLLVCSSVTFEGTGFKAAAVRAVVAGLTFAASPGFPHRILATVDQAATWKAGILSRVSAEDINLTVATLRRRLTESAAA